MDCGYRVPVLGRSICFVDRVFEVARLFGLAKGVHPVPIAVYGPEGCGKTTLLRYLIHKLDAQGYTVVYVDALAQDVREALAIPRVDVEEFAESIARDLGFPISTAISRLVARVVEELWARLKLFGRGLVVAVDDVYKAIGLENVDRYTKMLYEWISWRAPSYRVGNLLVLVTTSEGISKRVLARHTYVDIYMLWNLDLEGYREFVEQLNPHQKPEDLYTVTGGNPRLTIEVARYGWSIERVMNMYRDRIASTVKDLQIDRAKLKALAKDPDIDPETAKKLEEAGLMIELFRSSSLTPAPRDPALGIGDRWAWQTPLYRDIAIKIT